MLRSLLPTTLALAATLVAMPASSDAQSSSDVVFEAFVTSPGSTFAFGSLQMVPDASRAAVASDARAGRGTTEDETSAEEREAPVGWFTSSQRYAVGGAAALAAGLALSHYAAGSDGDPAGQALGGAPTPPGSFDAIAGLPAGPGLAPALADAPVLLVNPEPGTVLLLGTGLAGLLAVARRRRAS